MSRLRGSRPRVKTIDGIVYELDLAEVIDSSLYYSGTFEQRAERIITGALRPGMTAIDIGANIGYHTFRMARAVAPTGRVLAIEPMSRAFAKLQRNLSLNAIDNVELLQVALGDHEAGPTQVAFQANYRLDGRVSPGTDTVRLTTLDAVVSESQLRSVDFIKLDVDGYEGKVFRGAAATLATYLPRVFFEITPKALAANGDDLAALVRQLTDLGYTFSAEDGTPILDLVTFCHRIPGEHSANVLATSQQPRVDARGD